MLSDQTITQQTQAVQSGNSYRSGVNPFLECDVLLPMSLAEQPPALHLAGTALTLPPLPMGQGQQQGPVPGGVRGGTAENLSTPCTGGCCSTLVLGHWSRLVGGLGQW